MQNHAEVNSPSFSCIYSSSYSSNCYANPPHMVPCLHSSYTSFNGPIIPNTLSVNDPLPLSSSLTFNSHFPITVNSPNSVITSMSDTGPINTMLPVNSRFSSSIIFSVKSTLTLTAPVTDTRPLTITTPVTDTRPLTITTPVTDTRQLTITTPVTDTRPLTITTLVTDTRSLTTTTPVIDTRPLTTVTDSESFVVWSIGKGFSVLHLNIHFLYPKLDEIKLLNFDKQLYFLYFCETFLNDSFSDHEL